MAEQSGLEVEAEEKTEFTKDELLNMGAQNLETFSWYLYLDDRETGQRTIYEPKDSGRINYVQRGGPFPIPKN